MTIGLGVPSRSRAIAVVLLGAAMVPTPARTEESVPAFACEARASLSAPSGARLVAHHPAADQQRRLAAAEPRRFGPFDRAAYGFEWVLFYVDVAGPGEDWGRFEPADVLLRFEGPRSPWFRIAGLETSGPQLIVCRASDAEHGAVRRATPDSTLPLFVVEATTEDTRSDVTLQYLIDLRPGRPRVPALLECVEMIAWGACGVWDASYASVSGPIACSWQGDDADFRCQETQGIEAPWGGRSAVREFMLLSPPEAEAVREARVSSELAGLARACAAGPSARRDVDAIGPVHCVTVLARVGGGSLVLLGAAGSSSSFGARFFLGTVAKDGSAQVRLVIERDLSPSFWRLGEFDGRPLAVPGTPQPGELSFRAWPLASVERGPTILRVRVRESIPPSGVTPVPAEAVYWVGTEDRGNEVIAGALRLATNTAEYTRCAGARTAPNAVSVRIASGQPFAADLEVEPPHPVDLFSEGIVFVGAADPADSPPPECPVRTRVTWNEGFEVSEPAEPAACPAAEPRLVRIDEDGGILASAGPRAREDAPPP
jgi:hypothetical protein